MNWYKLATWELEHQAEMAWLDALPDNPYEPCPCGCGKKMKYILQEARELQAKGIDTLPIDHEQIFKDKWKKEHPLV